MKKIVIINKMKKYEEILHNKINLLYEKLFYIFLLSVQALCITASSCAVKRANGLAAAADVGLWQTAPSVTD